VIFKFSFSSFGPFLPELYIKDSVLTEIRIELTVFVVIKIRYFVVLGGGTLWHLQTFLM
jgi:hypothetical protein